jgi:hypothetical protein
VALLISGIRVIEQLFGDNVYGFLQKESFARMGY